MSDLIERLRGYGKDLRTTQDEICDQAADEIERLSDQNSSLLATNYDLRKERDRMTDELAEALAALQERGIHLESANCWCRPEVVNYATDAPPSPKEAFANWVEAEIYHGKDRPDKERPVGLIATPDARRSDDE